MNKVDIIEANEVFVEGVQQTNANPLLIDNNGATADRLSSGSGANKPLRAEAIRFTNPGAGEIAAITHNVSALNPKFHAVAAVSALQAIAMKSETAAVAAQAVALSAALTAANTANAAAVAAQAVALSAALTAANTANAAALAAATAAANSTINALAAQVNTLKSGFCPPAAAGRHLLSTLTPIVPPASCNTATSVTTVTDIVTTTLSLTGINLATFSFASVATALANAAGVHASDITVSITDFPVSTTVSFAGAGLTSLTAAQVTGIEAAIDAKLPATAMVPALGTVTPAGRRLLDLSVPVTVTAVGTDPVLAAQTQTAITNAATLGAAATAAGVPSSAVTATPATVSAVMTITVRAASAASAASIATALSPANSAAISTQLAAAGVSHTGLTITTPVLSKPLAPASSSMSGQDKQDLLALLVLLVIPAAGAAYFVGKHLERQRAARTQDFSKAHAVDTISVVETA